MSGQLGVSQRMIQLYQPMSVEESVKHNYWVMGLMARWRLFELLNMGGE